MEENDILEIQEQEELFDNQPSENENPPYTEEEFDTLLTAVYTTFLQQGEEYDAHSKDDLYQLFVRAKEDMDANSLMKLLYMTGRKYVVEGNKNGSAYCTMRMQAIQSLYHGRRKQPRFLILNPLEATEKQASFIQEETAFIADFLKDMYKKLLLMSILMFVVLMLILLLALKLDLVYASIEALLMSALAYTINKLRLPKMFERKQLDVLAKHVDKEVLELDAPIRFS